jgi:hypothetical protein
MIGGGGLRALLSAGGGKGLYAGVWGNLAGACRVLLADFCGRRGGEGSRCTEL